MTWKQNPEAIRWRIMNALESFYKRPPKYYVCSKCGDAWEDKRELYRHQARKECEFPKKKYKQLKMFTKGESNV